jgi:hypothetical protein
VLADGTALHLGVYAGDELAGSVALNALDRAAGTAEIGYWSAPWARGRRVTERAGRALLEWAFVCAGSSGAPSRATMHRDGGREGRLHDGGAAAAGRTHRRRTAGLLGGLAGEG